MTENNNYLLPFDFKIGEEVYDKHTGDFYFVKGMERKRGPTNYVYHIVYVEDIEGNKKTFREWQLATNEPVVEEEVIIEEKPKKKKEKKNGND
jgi:hypothetical protein